MLRLDCVGLTDESEEIWVVEMNSSRFRATLVVRFVLRSLAFGPDINW